MLARTDLPRCPKAIGEEHASRNRFATTPSSVRMSFSFDMPPKSSASRRHGASKRRVRRRILLGIDAETLKIRAVEVTSGNVGDAPMLPDLLVQSPQEEEIATVTADGAYDTRACHDAIAARGTAAIIPPRRNARPWKPDTQRNPAGVKTAGPDSPAEPERLPPPEQCGNEDELREAARPAADVRDLQPPGGGPESLHGTRHPGDGGRRIQDNCVRG
ncbi:transposase [Rhodovulum sulfidophilum]|nr:transposase [Rhodovulum sulfidophilum]